MIRVVTWDRGQHSIDELSVPGLRSCTEGEASEIEIWRFASDVRSRYGPIVCAGPTALEELSEIAFRLTTSARLTSLAILQCTYVTDVYVGVLHRTLWLRTLVTSGLCRHPG